MHVLQVVDDVLVPSAELVTPHDAVALNEAAGCERERERILAVQLVPVDGADYVIHYAYLIVPPVK